MKSRKEYIAFLRSEGFNCFPIPKYSDDYLQPKKADFRYKSARTVPNQEIDDSENYGYIPVEGSGTLIVDFDHTKYGEDLKNAVKKNGHMLMQSGKGFHLPMKNISGNISKVELFDDSISDKKIIEIQGPKHYVMGIGCEIFHEKLKKHVTYENIGGDKILDAEGKDFHEVIDILCKNYSVKPHEDRQVNYSVRKRFKENKIPTTGTSDPYFFQAACVCYEEGNTEDEAIKRIEPIYDVWRNSNSFSGRPWENILSKISYVYAENIGVNSVGRKRGEGTIQRTEISQHIVEDRTLYSDLVEKKIFENKNGFLEDITDELGRELVGKYPKMEIADLNSIKFKILNLAGDIPPTDKELVVFKNGVFDRITHGLIKTDKIAEMGFSNYNYLEKSKENEPTRFKEMLFDNVDSKNHPRIKAALRDSLTCYLEPRISVIHGLSGVGKSTPLTILVRVLGVYAMSVELDQFLDDHFIRAKTKGKTLVVLQDLPQTWKDFAKIKTSTGEHEKTERGFRQDSTQFDNKMKIIATGNYLTKIPEKEKDPMFKRRLSLIMNTKKESYPENPKLINEIVEIEGEQMVSWILNFSEEECKYENAKIIQEEWERLASPEIEYLNKYEISKLGSDMSVGELVADYTKNNSVVIDHKQMKKSLDELGFTLKGNTITNIDLKPKPTLPNY